MRHGVLSFICILAALAAVTSCGRGVSSTDTIRIASLRGPSSIAMIRLIDSLASNDKVQMEVQIYEEPQQLRECMLEGIVDFAVLPSTMASLLYNKGVDYRAVAVPLWGSLFLCGTDDSVRCLEDLKGRTVCLMAKGMTPDVLFRYLLKAHGIELYRDVQLDYRFQTHIALANAAIAGRAPLCVLAEPYMSQALRANSDLHLLINLNAEWERTEASPEAETLLLCRGDIADRRDSVISKVVDAYAASANWVVAHPDSAASLSVKHGINPDSAAVYMSIPRSNIRVVSSRVAGDFITEYLAAFYSMSPEIIGGKMPDEKFIFK